MNADVEEVVSDNASWHPTVKQLQRYSVYSCVEEEWRRIGEHLHQCEDCQILLPELLTEID